MGLALTQSLTDCGIIGATGMVSVFHWQALRPLQSAGLFGQPWELADLGQVSGAPEAQSQSRGLGGRR